MRNVVLVGSILLLSSCGLAGRFVAGVNGYNKVCVDGVLYLQISGGVSVAYNPDGTIKTCEVSNE